MEQSSELFVRALTHILVKNGAIALKEERPLDDAFKHSAHDRYEMFLLDEGLVEPEDLLKALSEYYQVPSFDVTDYFFEHNLVHLFPKDFLLSNAMIPAEQDEEILLVVTANPADPDLLVKIGEFVSFDIQFCVGIYRDIIDAVTEFYDGSLTEKDSDDDDLSDAGDVEDLAGFEIEEEELVVDDENEG